MSCLIVSEIKCILRLLQMWVSVALVCSQKSSVAWKKRAYFLTSAQLTKLGEYRNGRTHTSAIPTSETCRGRMFSWSCSTIRQAARAEYAGGFTPGCRCQVTPCVCTQNWSSDLVSYCNKEGNSLCSHKLEFPTTKHSNTKFILIQLQASEQPTQIKMLAVTQTFERMVHCWSIRHWVAVWLNRPLKWIIKEATI